MNFFTRLTRIARHKRLKMVRHQRLKKAVLPYARCKNCDTELQGCYCHKCGQYVYETHQSFWNFIGHYIDNTFQTDGRAGRTIRHLTLNPGFLSKEFVKGRIAYYVHPMKLYLFFSLVFFALIFLFVNNDNELSQIDISIHNSTQNNVEATTQNPTVKFSLATTGAADTEANDDISPQQMVSTLISTLKDYSPLIILILLPLYGLVLRVFFAKSYKDYIPHFVFAIHITSFLMIVTLILSTILALIDESTTVLAIFGVAYFAIISVYTIMATRTFYGQGWVATIVKSAAAFYLNYLLQLIIASALIFIALAYELYKVS